MAMKKHSSEPTAGPTIIVDARQLECPEPVVRTKLALHAATAGSLLEIRVTDPLAPLDLEALCARTGDEFCGVQMQDGGELAVYVKKAPSG